MPSPDYGKITDRAVDFIRLQVSGAGAKGVVFGLSGGIDSAVIAHLAKKALGDRCLALIMPNNEFTPDSETDDGILVAQNLGIRHITIPIGEISRTVMAGSQGHGFRDEDHKKRTVGNLTARIRAMLLYHEAQKNSYLVAGTDDKSEYLIGYFTKYGDGASDMLPIVGLYKTQVQELGRFLGVPGHIVDKSPSPHLWKGHVAHDELGVQYDTIDKILSNVGSDAQIAARLGISPKIVGRITALNRASEHKRKLPPAARLVPDKSPMPIQSDRPWGHFERFTLNQESTVKIIHIKASSGLSLQVHACRSEYWQVLDGDAVATLDGDSIMLKKGDSMFVPSGSVHRLVGGKSGARILEIAFGDFDEDDITRLQDDWDR